MKLIISKSELLNALNICAKCVGGKIIPAHEDYLFTVTPGKLTVSATDGERFISFNTNCESVDTVSFQLPATTVNDLVKSIAEQPITIELDATTKFITNTGEFDFPFTDGKDYPNLTHKEKFSFTAGSDDFRSGLERVSFAVSTDYTRPALTGLLLELTKDTLTFTGCNGAVLSTVDLPGEYQNGNVLITQKTVSTVSSLPAEESVKVSVGEKSIRFTPNENTELTCVIIDEKYPEYRGVIPSNNKFKFDVSRTELLSALNRIKIFGSKLENLLIVKIQLGAVVTLTAENHLSQAAKETVSGTYVGEEMEVMFNVNFLIGCLTRFTSQVVTLAFGESNKRAFTITAPEEKGLMLVVPYGKA